MLTRLFGGVVMALGCLILEGAYNPCEAKALKSEDLKAFSGGALQYCSPPVLDTGAVHCPQCTGTPTGSEQCSTQDLSYLPQYQVGQSPAQMWDYTTTACFGDWYGYTTGDCSGFRSSFPGGCSRNFNNATYLGTVPGVNCP